MGIEPTTPSLRVMCSAIEPHQRISVCRMLCYFSGFLLRSQGISVILLICRNFSRSAPGRQSRAGGVTGKRSLLDVQGLRKNGVEQLVGILDGLHIGEHRQGLADTCPFSLVKRASFSWICPDRRAGSGPYTAQIMRQIPAWSRFSHLPSLGLSSLLLSFTQLPLEGIPSPSGDVHLTELVVQVLTRGGRHLTVPGGVPRHRPSRSSSKSTGTVRPTQRSR